MRSATMADEAHEQPEEPGRKKVYLDQSVYGDILDKGGADWRTSPTAAVLLKADTEGRAATWAGPTNVIEVLQTHDPERRKQLASLMLELIDAKRMWWGHEFEAINEYIHLLESFAPGTLWNGAFFAQRAQTTRQIWLGGLGLLAATGKLTLTPVVASLRKLKATNQLLFARAAADPDTWYKRVNQTVENWETMSDEVFAEFDAMSLEQIERETHDLAKAFKKASKKTQDQLKINRGKISKAHGALEIGLLLLHTFTLPMELQLLFDAAAVVKGWPTFREKLGCPPLPKEISEADADDLRAEPTLFYRVLAETIRAAARTDFLTTALGFEVVLRETQKKFSAKKLPPGGLTFDADHAAALVHFNVVVCHDGILADSLTELADLVSRHTGGDWQPQVVRTADELAGALAPARNGHG
jgi:hypothetical protein